MKVEDAISNAYSWSNINNIQNKLSLSNVSTATFKQKVDGFDKLNPKFEFSPILPQKSYFGKEPDPETEDPF